VKGWGSPLTTWSARFERFNGAAAALDGRWLELSEAERGSWEALAAARPELCMCAGWMTGALNCQWSLGGDDVSLFALTPWGRVDEVTPGLWWPGGNALWFESGGGEWNILCWLSASCRVLDWGCPGGELLGGLWVSNGWAGPSLLVNQWPVAPNDSIEIDIEDEPAPCLIRPL
jgi:hypothetical protein